MEKHLQQTFDFRYLKIGTLSNAGVVQIGCGAGRIPRVPVVGGYTSIGATLVPLSAAPTQFAVPLQSPVRQK